MELVVLNAVVGLNVEDGLNEVVLKAVVVVLDMVVADVVVFAC